PNLSAQTEVVPVIRTPLYVSYKVVNWPAPDIYPNVAVKFVPAAYVPVASAEPVLWRRAAAPVESFTNVALMLSPSIGVSTSWNDLPAVKWPAVELYPNLAVRFAAPLPAIPP